MFASVLLCWRFEASIIVVHSHWSFSQCRVPLLQLFIGVHQDVLLLRVAHQDVLLPRVAHLNPMACLESGEKKTAVVCQDVASFAVSVACPILTQFISIKDELSQNVAEVICGSVSSYILNRSINVPEIVKSPVLLTDRSPFWVGPSPHPTHTHTHIPTPKWDRKQWKGA